MTATAQRQTTRERVMAMRAEDPRRSLTSMARAIGVSKERVRQICAELGLPTRFYTHPPCKACGRQILRDTSAKHYEGFCTRCSRDALYVHVRCATCGSWEKKVLATEVVWRLSHPPNAVGKPTRWFFCSQRCKGLFVGGMKGKNARIGPVDSQSVVRTAIEHPYWAIPRIARELGIDRKTVRRVLEEGR